MALRDVLVCIDATAAGDGRLELALNLAQAHQAHLTAVYFLPEPSGWAAPLAGMGLPPTVLSPVSPEGARAIGGQPISATAPAERVLIEAERVDIVEAHFREERARRSLDGEWHMLDHTALADLVGLAQAADLAILGQYSGNEEHGASALRPDDLMIDTGRPVLVIPYAGIFECVGRRVLVAWDGTREANRALHDALSLILGAEAVTVMHVGAQQADLDRDRPQLERIVNHLQRHGIPAQAQESPQGGIAICDVLLSRAADLGADMIVAGAYHHSHMRESLFGGVSRDLLNHMTVPVLMSH
jgi:nucleotide-binding universal stress UspA family protein